MFEISCREIIKSKINLLTNTESKIACFVLDHYQDVINSNISELAENANVSKATVVRFCKSMGYKGFQEFKLHLSNDIPQRVQHQYGIKKSETSDTIDICHRIFSSEIIALNHTLRMIQINEIEMIVEKMIAANKIIFIGTGSSLFVGRDAQHKLLKVGIKIYVYEDVDMQLMSSSLLEVNDIAFLTSCSGKNKYTLNCLKVAKENGATIVSLLTKGRTPISRMSDFVIYTDLQESIINSETINVNARIAQLAVIDIIVTIAALKKYDDSYNAIQLTRKATSDNKY
jgi:DNA-binding MurR/RpiR family transcriptional regulator